MPIAIAIVKSFNITIFLFLKADDDDAMTMTMKMKGGMGRRLWPALCCMMYVVYCYKPTSTMIQYLRYIPLSSEICT